MFSRIKLLIAAPMAVALTLAGGTAAFAATTPTVIVYPYGAIVSPTQVYMVAQVTCSPETIFTGPTVTVTQPQSAELTRQPPTTSGTGTTGPVVCDSQPHYYLIAVTATTGAFTPGPAEADISYGYKACASCVRNASTSEETITLFQGPSGQG